MASFYEWISTALSLQNYHEEIVFFLPQSPQWSMAPHLINLGNIKGRVGFEATQYFWPTQEDHFWVVPRVIVW